MNAPSESNSISNPITRVFLDCHRFSGGPVTQARLAVWSNHACQVALSLATEQLVRWPFPGDRTAGRSVLPRCQNGFVRWLYETSMASGNAPHGKKWCNKHVNQQALASFQRPPKMSLPSWSCCHWIGARNAPLSSREGSECEGAVGPSFSQRARPRPSVQGSHTARPEKKQRQRQGAHPEENRQRDITRSLS